MAAFDEMRAADGSVRAPYRRYAEWLDRQSPERLDDKRATADLLFRRLGVTFTVYGDSGGVERLIPFDIVPRILARAEWQRLADGLIQRVRALNAFLHDVYHGQEIVKAGKIPARLVRDNAVFRAPMQGVDLPGGVYAHIAGIDVVRTDESTFYVLEDNLRTPSGVSYMLKDREAMMSLFPDLFGLERVRPVQHYPRDLLATLRALAPRDVAEPTIVVLTPGIYNSAFFEHAFLAEQMGVELVQGADMFVENDVVYLRTIDGPQHVDVIYRRIDDDFLDPLAFRPDSALGVPGLFEAYRNGNVALANAIGAGVADDKATYTYVPEMVRFYLGEEPLLGNVPTWKLGEPDDLNHVLERLDQLVVKEVHGSGGYGMLIGPTASKAEIETYRARILRDPAAFIAQPTLALSTCPTLVEAGVAPRHVDLRPFVLSDGRTITVVPGGLTRVALVEGSLVVNSSQGGGTKDTWVLSTEVDAMLSRTADKMFWLARYIERAENLARLLDVSYRLSLLHVGEGNGLDAWRMGLEIADDDQLFAERYGRVTPEAVLTYLGLDRDNPASIIASLVRARENARILRNQITQEMWEAINDTWLGLERFEGSAARLGEGGVTVFLEWVRERSHLFRGVTYGTMLHDDGFWFIRLGTFIERADNTARLLLFKAAEVGPGDAPDAGDLVYYQWASLLRALGGFRGYHRTYRDAIAPVRVVEFALLNPAMPRSLRHCLDHVRDSLDWLETPADAPLRLDVESLHGQLKMARVEDLIARGLEGVLEDFMERNAALADELGRQYMGFAPATQRMEQSQASR